MGCNNVKDFDHNHKRDASFTQEERMKLEEKISRTNPRKVYNFEKVLGSGGFGIVKLGSLKSNPEKKVAIKIIEKKKLKDKIYMLMREVEVIKTLDHPNVVKFYEAYQDNMWFYIVMEHCSGGELLEYLTQKKYFREKEAQDIMYRLFSAVNHMHARGIVHRDLKPENILYSSKDKEEIKIIDFGLSNKYDTKKLHTMVGTPYYVAPEILLQKPYDGSCDAWSLGVIMYILLCGYPPFFGGTKQEIYHKIENCIYSLTTSDWIRVSSQAKDLIRKLLEREPAKRITIDQALNHPWFLKNERRMSKADNTGVFEQPSKIDNKILELLQNFRSSSVFKKEVMKVLVNQLNEKEILGLKELFIQLDSDNTGLITAQELHSAIKSSGMTMDIKEIQDIIQSISRHEDGTSEKNIKYSEFIAATLDQRRYLSQEKLWGLFNYFDYSQSGFITKSDLKEIFLRNGVGKSDEEIASMIKEVDPNSDGQISFDEFQDLMNGEVANIMPVKD